MNPEQFYELPNEGKASSGWVLVQMKIFYQAMRLLSTGFLVSLPHVLVVSSFTNQAQGDVTRWDATWRRQVEVQVEETFGLARIHEPVEVRLPSLDLSLERWRREARVVELPGGGELPSQVLEASDKSAVLVAFQVGLRANEKRSYRIYFDNATAKDPAYETDLTSQPVTGFVKIEPRRPFALSIRNEHLRVDLHPKSGQIGKLAFLKGTGDLWSFVGGNQNSNLHWNPDLRNRSRLFDAPGLKGKRAWEYVHYWDPPPNALVEVGPVLVRVRRWGAFAHTPEVFCSVTYTIHAHRPLVVVDTELKMLKDYDLEFLRDDEFGFKLGFNRALWKEKAGTVLGWDLTKLLPIGSEAHGKKIEANGILPLEPDCPWITFYHDETADAVAVIHTRYENGAVGKVKMDPPMSFIHVKGPVYNYWGRVLAGKLHRLPQAKLKKGLEWKTQSVLLTHQFKGKGEPKTLLHFDQRLRQPMKVTVLP